MVSFERTMDSKRESGIVGENRCKVQALTATLLYLHASANRGTQAMKVVAVALALVSATLPLSAQVAPSVATTLPAAELTTLEAVRKAVWVDWFSGDTAALRRSLAPELVAISPGAPHWQSLQESIAGSAKFRADGGRLVSVAFDSSMVHRFGDAVVMFSHYIVVTAGSQGQRTQKGRATEVFVRSNGRWVHTSWHLDVDPALPAP